jgi:hypothetical protein
MGARSRDRARPGFRLGTDLVAGTREGSDPVPRRPYIVRGARAVCRRWWRNRGKRSQDRRRTDKDATKPQPWAGCSRAVLASRSSSSSRRSSATFIEVSVGSRVAGPDQYVGGLLDQDSFASLDMATYGIRVLCAKASLETSERQTVRQPPAAGAALFGARVLCAFAYWQGARDRQIWRGGRTATSLA